MASQRTLAMTNKEESDIMSTPFTIDLTITLPGSGRLAKQLLNIYFADMAADINKTAYNLCEANATIQAQKFAQLTLKRADVWASKEGSLKVFALFSVSGEDSPFVEKVIAQYMDGFSESLKNASQAYFSRSAEQSDVSYEATDWKVEVHQV
jgi:hypothetical protein